MPDNSAVNSAFRNKLYNFLLKRCSSELYPYVISLVAFIDAAFIPVPVSTLYIILTAINPAKNKEYLFSALSGAVSGALLAFTLGRFFWAGSDGEISQVAVFLTNNLQGFSQETLSDIAARFSGWYFIALFAGAFTVLPYSLFAVFAGISGVNIFTFLIAAICGHGIKFLILSEGTVRLRKISPKIFSASRKFLNFLFVKS